MDHLAGGEIMRCYLRASTWQATSSPVSPRRSGWRPQAAAAGSMAPAGGSPFRPQQVTSAPGLRCSIRCRGRRQRISRLSALILSPSPQPFAPKKCTTGDGLSVAQTSPRATICPQRRGLSPARSALPFEEIVPRSAYSAGWCAVLLRSCGRSGTRSCRGGDWRTRTSKNVAGFTWCRRQISASGTPASPREFWRGRGDRWLKAHARQ